MKKTTEEITAFLREVFDKEGFGKAVIAVSGGVDSSVALVLAVRALGRENVFCLQLPYKGQSVELSDLMLDYVRIPKNRRVKIDIGKAADSFKVKDKARLGNIMARVRMIYCFDFARKERALVVGTENKSEKLLGYYTRFGDEAADVEPIIHLYKTEVWALAKYLKLPREVIDQVPTAGLWAGQTDEKELGFSYREADNYFQGEVIGKLIEKKIVKHLSRVDFKKRVPYTL